ncbi:hypothetical protein E2320_003406 [Naja naja]|nr:hypothetical protein E2320_003406 [Naja naja]
MPGPPGPSRRWVAQPNGIPVRKKKMDPSGQPTCSAHPARFSPDDKYSRHRITIKKRFGVLMTQQPRPVV